MPAGQRVLSSWTMLSPRTTIVVTGGKVKQEELNKARTGDTGYDENL
jgi:hypothetical protein